MISIDNDIEQRFDQWTILLDDTGKEEFWADIAWLIQRCTPSESAWTACKDRLPPDGLPVLAFIPDREYRRIAIGTVLQRDDGIVWEFNNNIAHEKLNDAGVFPSTKFTHWMPLPEVPHVER